MTRLVLNLHTAYSDVGGTEAVRLFVEAVRVLVEAVRVIVEGCEGLQRP